MQQFAIDKDKIGMFYSDNAKELTNLNTMENGNLNTMEIGDERRRKKGQQKGERRNKNPSDAIGPPIMLVASHGLLLLSPQLPG